MTQLDILESAYLRYRSTDPDTSKAAAEHVSFAHAHYTAILGALGDGEATIYQIAHRTGLSHVQVARRLPEMQSREMVCPTGQTVLGPTGRQCRLWRRI
jgi:predicted Rossmann fold nucleotide-binding protein DprA/Smf involved in DNA uptake